MTGSPVAPAIDLEQWTQSQISIELRNAPSRSGNGGIDSVAPASAHSADLPLPLDDNLRQWLAEVEKWQNDVRVPDPKHAGSRTIPLKLIRDYGYTLQDTCDREQEEMEKLESIAPVEDADLFARITHVAMFIRDAHRRCDAYIAMARTIPLEEISRPCTVEHETEYYWTVDATMFIDAQIEKLHGALANAKHRADSPVAKASTRPTPSGRVTMATEETSNTLTRRWYARSDRRRPGRPVNPNKDTNTVGDLSSSGPHKATLATLAAISFLGASVSWSSVFSGERGDLVLLAWASATFVTGAVAAGSMSIIIESDRINFDRDMGARRAVRAYGLVAGIMTLAGIILLGVATAGVEPNYAAANDSLTASEERRVGMHAAGWFVVVAVLVETGIAGYIRVHYHRGPYWW